MNIFQQFIKSLHSPETIAKFRFQKIGRTIFYVFFLMFLTSIPTSIILGNNLSNLYDEASTHVIDSFPDFSIENGVLTSDVDEPIIIEDDESTLIFDPTGEYTVGDLSQMDNAFALLEREAVLISDGYPQTAGYQEFGLNISSEQLSGLIDSFGELMPLIITLIIILAFLFSTAMKFIGIFTLSLITLLLKRKTASQLSYRHCWVLSAYAVTLPTVLFALFDTIGFHIPFSFAIYWVIAIVMMNLVLRNIPTPKQQTPTEPR